MVFHDVDCRETQQNPYQLDVLKKISLTNSQFNPRNPTKVIIHGFGGGRNLAPSTDLRKGMQTTDLMIFYIYYSLCVCVCVCVYTNLDVLIYTSTCNSLARISPLYTKNDDDKIQSTILYTVVTFLHAAWWWRLMEKRVDRKIKSLRCDISLYNI